jgi:hypothetical protein
MAAVICSLALVPIHTHSSSAQQQSLKDQLVGSWALVSNEQIAPNGEKKAFFGEHPRGFLILDASGKYAAVFGKPDRAKFKSASRFDLEKGPPELKDAFLGFAANAGSWSVNEADKTLIRRYETALIPNNEGSEQKETVTLRGDELKTSRVSPVSGVRFEAVYRRAK